MNGPRQLLLAGVLGGALFLAGRWTSNAWSTPGAAPPVIHTSPVGTSGPDRGVMRLSEEDVLRIRDRVVASLPASAPPPTTASEPEQPSDTARSADEALRQRLDAALTVGRWSADDAIEFWRVFPVATREARVEALTRITTSINAGALRLEPRVRLF